jgi:predicted aspartyl protease
MIIHCDRQQSFINRAALLGAVAFFALPVVSGAPRDARAAASVQAPAKVSEAMVYATADESSPLIETVRDGSALSPVAEMTGPGGVKWFMVKTRSGNVGWIKAGDHAEARRVDDHFRTMPKDAISIGPASSAPEAATKTSATGAISIPVKMSGNTVVVPVTFYNGNSSVTGNLAVDTGAGQTMVSKRMAREIRLLSIASQQRRGIGGTVLAEVGVVESIKVGEAEVKKMRVSIHDFSPDPRYEGLLGFDFLGRFQMSVDSEQQVMVLTPRKK